MNHYEEKLAARKARLEDRAARLAREGNARYEQARSMASVIPFGQPILVGHHSEKRDRNYRGRIHSNFGKAFATLNEAKEVAARAESVGTGGISSDDPDAVVKLREQLAEREAEQAKMKAVNKALAKKDDSALVAMGYDAAEIAALKAPDFMGRTGHPSYRLSNNNANIRRIKQRIASLAHHGERETKEVLHNSGVKLVENAEENRVQLIFPGKPSADVRGMLKSRGFRWSPMAGAWQRHLNSAGLYAAQCVLDQLAK